MRIANLLKQSFIDWDGRTAAVVFTQGCNFRCGYCHNPTLVLPELFNKSQVISEEEVFDYLEERKDWLDGVVVTGGEPTIHTDLPLFLKRIKDMNYRVKLDTNGSNPFMLDFIIKYGLVDFIAMDIKTIPDEELYSEITGIKNTSEIIVNILASIFIIKNSNISYEFRTTYLPKIHNDRIIETINNITGNDKHYKINEFRKGDTIEKYEFNDM